MSDTSTRQAPSLAQDSASEAVDRALDLTLEHGDLPSCMEILRRNSGAAWAAIAATLAGRDDGARHQKEILQVLAIEIQEAATKGSQQDLRVEDLLTLVSSPEPGIRAAALNLIASLREPKSRAHGKPAQPARKV